MATTSTRKTASTTAKAPATETTPESSPVSTTTDDNTKAPATETTDASDNNTKGKKPNGAKDGLFGALVASAKVVDKMPTQTKNGSSRINPFSALVKESYDNNQPRELAPVEASDLDRVVGAIRRGAASNGLGVQVVHAINEDGKAVITLKGKQKG